jgi:hypothetical protein
VSTDETATGFMQVGHTLVSWAPGEPVWINPNLPERDYRSVAQALANQLERERRDRDTWRKRAEEAEAAVEQIGLDLSCRTHDLSEAWADRDRLSRELAEEKMRSDGYGSLCGECEEREEKLEAKLAIAVKALNDITAERQNLHGRADDAQVAEWMCDTADTARRAIEEINSKETT